MIQKTQKSTPCENCSDRVLYCHATCEDYLAWCKKTKRIKEIDIPRKDGDLKLILKPFGEYTLEELGHILT